MGAQDTPHRFRVNKRVALPKFISPKDPFKSETQAVTAEARPKQMAVEKPQPVRATNAPAVTAAPRKFSPTRAVQWVGELGKKFNPLALLPRKPRAASAAKATRLPVQPEFSLDTVRVLRNDLSDADAEADVTMGGGTKRHPASVLAVAARARAVGQVMDRLSSKLFDAGPV